MKRQLLTLALLLCAVMGNATAIFNGQGQGTQSSPYEIWNLDRLNEVRNFVGDESSGVYFRLEKDLDLTEYLEGLSWEAIGTSTEPFKGVFLGKGSDGKSHKITGMTISESSNYQGFFGSISGATIQDLTIEGTVSGGSYVGGIAGSASGTSTIKNCTFNGNVTGSGSYVGGIAGFFHGTLNNVKHTGTTKGAGSVGGIVGQHASGSMTTATNTGNVTATTSAYAGGIAGMSQVAMSSANSKGAVTGKQYTGGLAGSASGSAVSNCSAEGNVTGTNYTGGLIGAKSGGTVSGCSAKGTVNGSAYTGGLIGQCSGSVSNSRRSEGNVKGGNYVGGLIGNLSSGSVTSCFSYGNVTGTDNVGGIVGRYELADGVSPQIASSGFFGNISARSYVGGILGQIEYTGTGTLKTGDITIPTLYKYKTYSEISENLYEETWTEGNNAIVNCAAIGDVIGTSSYVGGILGKGCGGKYYKKNSNSFYTTHYTSTHAYNSNRFLYYKTFVTSSYYSEYYYYENPGAQYYYTYTLTETSTSLTDNYFSGNLKGTDYVGGVAGYMHGGTVSRNYSYAAITGSNKVGGIVGCMEADLDNITTTISSNVTLNSTVTATADAGKVYGYKTGSYLTIATSGNSINKTLNTTNLIVNGVTQTTSNSAQHGTLQTQRQLTQSTAYSGLGWNFDIGKEWTSEESKSYPYHQWQTAPPTIETGVVKGSTTLTGKCTDDGTVYVTISGSSTVYQATCSGGNWSLTIPTLKSGDLIRAWSKNANKEQSYQTAIIADSPGSGTENDPWLIYDAYDLKGVAKAGYYKMMNDVDLTSWISANSSSTGWPGVGSNGTGSIIFDGNNKKVTGLWCNTTTSQNGLFSYLENAIIKDLTVEVASGKQMKGGDYTAILAGQLKNSTVTNVTVKGTVNGTLYVAALIASSEGNTISGCNVVSCTINSATSSNMVAGMVASSKNDNINNCTVNATVKTTASSTTSVVPCRGGIVANLHNGTMTDCSFDGTITTSESSANVGGIVGDATNISIDKCQANANITASGADTYAGGLLGSCETNSSVSQCFTKGTVVASGTTTYAGGLVGYTDATSPVDNSMSTANVTGTGYVGGIVGYAKGSVKKCVATGSLLNSSDDGRAGGIVGFIEGSAAIIKGCGGLNKRIETGSNQWGFRIIGGTGNNITSPAITDNYGWDEMPILRNNSIKTVYDDPYEGTAKTSAQLQQQSTYTAMGWDFTDIWTMSSETHQPMLQWLAMANGSWTFDAPVPCGNGTVNLTFKVTNASPLEVEVSASPQNISGALTIPTTVTDDGGNVFSVKSIGDNAFNSRGNLTSVTISEGITSIGEWAFEDCDISSVTIPSTVTSIGIGAFFDEDDNLETVYSMIEQPFAIDFDVFGTDDDRDVFTTATLYVPEGTKELYKATNGWKNFKKILDETETAKGDLNGDGTVSITDVVLIIDVIAGEITDANKVAAADVNGDGDVTITDCVAAIDLIAAQQTSGARRDTNNGQQSMVNGQWSTTDFISASMQDNMLNVALNNERSYTAFQMVVSVSEGMTIGKATIDKMRGEEHQAVVRDLGNGQYLVAGFSADNDVLTGNNGRLLSIATNGKASGDIVISNVEFATTEAEAYRLADAVVSGTTTSVQYVTTESQQKSQTYDLQGRRMESPIKGLYIRNGKKVNVK